jgi:hypothetical protein
VYPYPAGAVFCTNNYVNGPGTPTAIVDVVNPTTGKTWMDRNLGAMFATERVWGFGDLYQWGRKADGHQCRLSKSNSVQSKTDDAPHDRFVAGVYDWRSPSNDNLWQGVNGVNNPCPSGYRLPTITELNAEVASWSSQNAAGAIASPLKLPLAGYKTFTSDGTISSFAAEGYYWSSTVCGNLNSYCSKGLWIRSSVVYEYPNVRTQGNSVRCIKD